MTVVDSTPARARARDENFPVALRVLPPALRRDLWALYRFARHTDDLGDEYAGDRVAALDELAGQVRRLYAGEPVTDPVVEGIRDLVRTRGVPVDPWLRLVEANLVDQRVTRYETFDDLLGYCRLSADPVGEIVLHLVGQADARRIALSDRICTGLQLVEHWQDVAEDHAHGRVYLPQEDLRRFGVTESDLVAAPATPQVRALMAFETDRARRWLDAGAPLVGRLRGAGRLAVSAYLAGGRAAAEGLARRGYDPTVPVVKPRARDIVRAWVAGSQEGRRP